MLVAVGGQRGGVRGHLWLPARSRGRGRGAAGRQGESIFTGGGRGVFGPGTCNPLPPPLQQPSTPHTQILAMCAAGALVLSTAEAGPSAAYELVLAGSGGPGGSGGGGKILGSREFARYYRQRPRLGDTRTSVQAAMVQAQYRRLAVPLLVRHRAALGLGGRWPGVGAGRHGARAVQWPGGTAAREACWICRRSVSGSVCCPNLTPNPHLHHRRALGARS